MKIKHLEDNEFYVKRSGTDISERQGSGAGKGSKGIDLEEWIERLSGFERELFTLGSGTEGEFISIGSRLRDFHGRAGNISKMFSSVAAFMSGDDMVKTIDGLNVLLEKMELHLKKSEAETKQRLAKLRDILQTTEGLIGPLDDFSKITKNLRALGIATKIQGAAHNCLEGGFDVISLDVKNLAEVIRAKSAYIHEDLKKLRNTIEQTLARLVSLEIRQQGKARAILNKTVSSLCSLTEKYGQSSTLATDVSESAVRVSKSIAEVVTSLQFHDITRQQFDHVKHAIKDFGTRLGAEAARSEEGVDGASLAYEIGDFCDILAPRLRGARDEFVTAVEGIVVNLEGITSNVAGMSRETSKLASGEGDGGQSIFLGMENMLSSITLALSALTENDEACREMHSIYTVTETTRQMSGYIKDIEEISNDLELIALNAGIKAAHIGDAGRSLGVLAESTQGLSVEARKLTTQISGVLKNVAGSTEKLSAALDPSAGGQESDMDDMHGDLNSLIQILGVLNKNITALLGDIDAAGQTLSENIIEVKDGISVHRTVNDVVSGIVSGLEEIEARSGSLLPDGQGRRKTYGRAKDFFSSTPALRSRAAQKGDGTAPAGDSGGDDVEFF